MRAVLQRVSRGRVSADSRTLGQIESGLVVLLGVAAGDGEEEARWMASKIAELRVFEDDAGKMNLSVREAGGAVLLVSQFTLLAACRKGRRPSFTEAAPPELGAVLYRRVGDLLREHGLTVETGEFGARMSVTIENDGPVTIILDSDEGSRATRGRKTS